MTTLNSNFAKTIIDKHKENLLFGRWITLNDIEKVFQKIKNSNKLSVHKIGASEENRSIYQIDIGNGPKKILIWTQMHGNESTGTKAVFDFIHYHFLVGHYRMLLIQTIFFSLPFPPFNFTLLVFMNYIFLEYHTTLSGPFS